MADNQREIYTPVRNVINHIILKIEKKVFMQLVRGFQGTYILGMVCTTLALAGVPEFDS
jgi:hypothetical protein